MSKKVAVVGSRDFYPLGTVREFVRSLPSGTTVVSGGARGVDRCAENEAMSCGLDVVSFPAEWERHGSKAGFLRNRLIVEAADEVHAFWDGKSKGTLSTINLANAAKKPVVIHR